MTNDLFVTYIHYNLFRPKEIECYCQEFEKNKKEPNCFCVPIEILNFTLDFFGIKDSRECKCPLYGTKSKKTKYGFSRYELDKSSSNNIYDSSFYLIDLQLATEPGLLNLANKDYIMLLCLHFGTLISIYEKCDKYYNKSNVQYSTTLNNILKAYESVKKDYISYLREVYFYICFCLRGKDILDDKEIIELYRRIKKCDKNAANNIYISIKKFGEHCKNYEEYLSNNYQYIDENEQYSLLASIFQFLIHISTFKNNQVDRIIYLKCEKFILLSERVNIAFSYVPSNNKLSRQERLLLEIKNICNDDNMQSPQNKKSKRKK